MTRIIATILINHLMNLLKAKMKNIILNQFIIINYKKKKVMKILLTKIKIIYWKILKMIVKNDQISKIKKNIDDLRNINIILIFKFLTIEFFNF